MFDTGKLQQQLCTFWKVHTSLAKTNKLTERAEFRNSAFSGDVSSQIYRQYFICSQTDRQIDAEYKIINKSNNIIYSIYDTSLVTFIQLLINTNI